MVLAKKLIKKELGNDAILMHSREVKPSGLFSFLKKPRMEITVAKEEENDRPAARIKAAEADLREKIAKVDKARQKAESEAVAKAASSGKGDASEEPEKKSRYRPRAFRMKPPLRRSLIIYRIFLNRNSWFPRIRLRLRKRNSR